MITIQKSRNSLGALCAAALMLAGAAHAAESTTYWSERKGSKVTVAGDSSIHAWTVEADLIGGKMQLDASSVIDGKTADVKVTPTVKVTIPLRNLKSGKEGMDNVMMQAMKSTDPKNKFIIYELTKMTPRAGKPLEYDTFGQLTICGVKKTVAMPVKLQPLEGGKKVKVTGSIGLKMTDFKITPPKPKIALGLLTVDDDIKVSFEWMTARSEKK
ncbi:MAG: polyisoprenoid-binding protein YceI [Candidatus Binatia bacterium]|jgi:polyisoprenoid-binding protein YceI